jgi:prostaglandin-H2 D-isomerase / glutathione transferase
MLLRRQASWVANIGNVTDTYKNETVPEFHQILSHFYSLHEGPYLLGNEITYTDFAVFQALDNDKAIGAITVRTFLFSPLHSVS